MSDSIDPKTGLNKDTDRELFFNNGNEDRDLQFNFEEASAAPTQLGATDVGSYFRDEDLSFEDVAEDIGGLNQKRAEIQTGWELAGKALGQMATEATIGAAEGVAYALDFEEIFNHDKQAQEGFDNWAAKGLRKFKENLQEDYFNIYQTEDAAHGSLGDKMRDATWWANQGKTAGTTLSLMFPAMGVGALVGAAGKAAKMNAALQMGMKGTSAAMFSRKAESAMEANQQFQSQYPAGLEDEKLQQKARDLTDEQFKEIGSNRQALENYLVLSNTLNNPASGEYAEEEANKKQELEDIRGQLSEDGYNDLYAKNLDQLARERAGEIASKTFKANAAMLPLDMLQYTLLLGPMKGVADGMSKLGKSTASKVANNLVVQPLSEGFEEGYQFVSGEEAVHSTDTGGKMFGEGFGNRMAEYSKDPHFHEAVFLGGAMGLVFSGAGPAAKGLSEKTEQFVTGLKDKNIAKNPNRVAKIVEENTGYELARSYKSGNLDTLKEGLTNELDRIQNKEGATEEEINEATANYEKLIADADKLQEIDNELLADDKFTENHVVRQEYALAKMDSIRVDENIKKHSEEKAALMEEVNFDSEGFVAFEEDQKAEAIANKKEVFETTMYLNSLKEALSTAEKSSKKELPPKYKQVLVAKLTNEIKKAEQVLDGRKNDVAIEEKLQRSSNALVEQQAKKTYITDPVVKAFQEKFETKEEADKQEEKEGEKIDAQAVKAMNLDWADKINKASSLGQVSEIESQIENISEISAENKTALEQKKTKYEAARDTLNAKKVKETVDKVNEIQSIEDLNVTREAISNDESLNQDQFDLIEESINQKELELNEVTGKDGVIKEDVKEPEQGFPRKAKARGKDRVIIGESKNGKKYRVLNEEKGTEYFVDKDQVEFEKETQSVDEAPLVNEVSNQEQIKDYETERDAIITELDNESALGNLSDEEYDAEAEKVEKEYADKIAALESAPVGETTEINPAPIQNSTIVGTAEYNQNEEVESTPLPEEQVENDIEAETDELDERKQNPVRTFVTSLVVKFKEINGKKVDAYDKNGELIVDKSQLRSSIPNKFDEGSEVIIAIDTQNKDSKGKSLLNKKTRNREQLPIGIWSKEDYDAGLPATVWIKAGKNASESDKAIRETIFNKAYPEGGKTRNEKVALSTTVLTHHSGYANKTETSKPLNEQLKQDDEYHPDAVVGTASRTDLKISGIDLDGGTIEAESVGIIQPGLAYVMIKSSDGLWYPIMLKREPISKHSDAVKDSFDTNAFNIIMSFIRGNTNEISNMDDLFHEVGKYYNLVQASTSEVYDAKINPSEKGKYNNHFALGLSENKNEYLLQLPGKDGFKKQEYRIISKDGKIFIYKFIGAKSKTDVPYMLISQSDLMNDFKEKMQNMYPNIKNFSNPQDISDFTRLEYNKGKLQRTKPQHYYDFLSETGIETRVHGLETSTGEFVFTASPSIEIDPNTKTMSDYQSDNRAEVVKKEKDQKNIDTSRDTNDSTIPPIPENIDQLPGTDDLFGMAVDPDDMNFDSIDEGIDAAIEAAIEKKASNKNGKPLESDINYQYSSLESFAHDQKIVQTFTAQVLAIMDKQKQETGSTDLNKAIDEVKSALENRIKQNEKIVSDPKTSEIAKKRAKKYARMGKAVLNLFEETKNDNDQIKHVGYRELIKRDYDQLGFNATQEQYEEYSEELEEEGKAESKEAFVSGKNYKEDPEKSASARVRRLFYGIMSINPDGSTKGNKLGMPLVFTPGAAFNYLMEQLAGIHQDDIMDQLKALAENTYDKTGKLVHAGNPIAQSVLAKMNAFQKTNPEIVNEFLSVMKKQRTEHMTLIYDFSLSETGLPKLRIAHSNKTGVVDYLEENWSENFEMIMSASENLTEDGKIDPKYADKLYKDYQKVFKDFKSKKIKYEEFKTQVIQELAKIGIEFSTDAMKQLEKEFNKKDKYFSKKFGAKANANTFSEFLGNVTRQIYLNGIKNGISPFLDEKSSIRELAFYQSKYEENIAPSMFKNGNGDNIYTYVNHHSQSNIISALVSNPEMVQDLMRDDFTKYSPIGIALTVYNTLKDKKNLTPQEKTKLKNASAQVENFGMAYFDSSKNNTPGSFAKAYQKQSAAEKEITKFGLFMNNVGNAFYSFFPTPSDKTTFILSKMLRISTKGLVIQEGKLFYKKGKENEGRSILNRVNDVLVNSEIARINSTVDLFEQAKAKYQTLVENGMSKKEALDKAFQNLSEGQHYIKGDTITDYKLGAGAYFFFIPKLNEIAEKEGMRADDMKIQVSNNKEAFFEALKDSIAEMVEDRIDVWRKVGIVKKTRGKKEVIAFDSGSSNSIDFKGGTPQDIAMSYVVNSIMSLANSYMTVTGDPSKFGKSKNFDGNPKNYMKLIEATHSNMFKRIAKDIAPGFEGHWAKDKKLYKVMILSEPKADAELYGFSEKLKKAYKGIDVADAQEWTTFEEHLDSMLSIGRISKAKHKDLLDKYNAGEDLSDADIGVVLQPMKPVQVLNQFDEGLKQNMTYYIKTSSFPLIPQLTRDFPEIDRLRQIMETNDIQRTFPPTAIKVGARNIVDVNNSVEFEADGITLANEANKVMTLNRDGFRFQQEVPHDILKEHSTEGSQFKKIITSDLMSDPDTEITIKLNGDVLTPKQAKRLNDAIHNKRYDLRYQNFLAEIGVNKENLSLLLDDVSKLKEILNDEAVDRGYTENDILALRTIVEGDLGVFENPLFFHPMVHKMESLLTSIVKNRVLKNKLPGKSFVQGSSYGFRAVGMEFLDFIKGSKSGIVYTDQFDPDKGLQTYKRKSDGALVHQVMIPMPFKGTKKFADKNGKVVEKKVPLDIQDYVNEKGYLDTSKLPKEMLEMIGYRIPTQKFSSMAKIEIVGFLPATSGDLVIIPPAMTAQMGSDFDVDKLTLHWYNYNVAEDGTISMIEVSDNDVDNKSEKELENLFLKMSHSVLENEHVQNETLTPLDNKDISNVIEIDRTKEKDKLSDKILETIKTQDFSELTASELKKISLADIRSTKSDPKLMSHSVLNDMVHSEMVEIQAAGQQGISVESIAATFHGLGQYAGLYLKGQSVKFSNKKDDIEEFSDYNVDESKGSVSQNLNNGTYSPSNNSVDKTITYEKENPEGAWRLDKVFGFFGKKITDVLTNIQTESVDNANNRRLHPMNLNGVTFDVANLIARAGFDERFIGFFLNQPIIQEYVRQYSELYRFDNNEFKANKVEALQQKLLKKVKSKQKFDELVSSNISMEEMVEGISTNGKDNALQAKILESFIVYDNASKDLNKVQRTANVDSKYLGSSLEDVTDKFNNFEDDVAGEVIGNGMGLHVDSDGNYTNQGYAYELGIKNSVEVFSQVVPLNSDVINKIIKRVEFLTGKTLRKDELMEITIALRSALTNEGIKETFGINDIDAYRKELLKDTGGLGNRLIWYRKRKGKDSSFLNSLTVKKPDNKKDPVVITHISSRVEGKDLSLRKQLDWLKLLKSPKDSVEFKLGFDLLVYATSFGTRRTANDFGRFIPIDFMSNTGMSEFFRGIDFYNTEDNAMADTIDHNFFIQYIQHNSKLAEKVKDSNLVKTDNPDVFRLNQKRKIYPAIIRTYTKATSTTPGRTNLFKLVEAEKGGYIRIPELGFGELNEYDLGIESREKPESIFNKNVGRTSTHEDLGEAIGQLYREKGNLKTTDKKLQLLEDAGFNEGVESTLKYLSENAYSDADKKLAAFMLEHKNLLSGIKLEAYDRSMSDENMINARGMYFPNSNKIVINVAKLNLKSENNNPLDEVLLHELTHAFTSALASNPAYQTEEQKQAFSELQSMIDDVNSRIKKGTVQISPNNRKFLSNIHEFISGVMTNESFRNELSEIEYNKKGIFERFSDFVAKIFGVKKGTMAYAAIENIVGIVSTTNSGILETARASDLSIATTDFMFDKAQEIQKECK